MPAFYNLAIRTHIRSKSPQHMTIVDVKNLRKEYGPLVAVKDVNFSIERGQVVGLIGPNGAGKTTILKMLATQLEPTDGEIRILGFDAGKEYLAIRERIGYMPDFFGLYDDLTITQCLTFFAKAYNVPSEKIEERIDAVLHYIDLEEKKDDFIQHLSRGMVQRLGLGVLLVHGPEMNFSLVKRRRIVVIRRIANITYTIIAKGEVGDIVVSSLMGDPKFLLSFGFN